MGLQTEALRTQVLEAVAARLEGDLATFSRALFSGLSRPDLSARTPEDLVACARSLWDFAEQRPSGEAKVRVVRPDPRSSAWLGTPILVEIVNDDMPFLVDTVTSALATGRLAADLTVEILLHPIVRLTRDATGKRMALGEGKAESLMQIGLGGTVEDEDFPAIEASLSQALNDTRLAVHDWKAILHRLSVITAELDDPALASAPISAGEVEETKAFLTWLADNHMTLLGYREYVLETVNGEQMLKITEDSGLGILRDPNVSIFDGVRTLSALPPEVRAFLESPTLLTVTKANQRATVHRPVHMDVVSIKKLDATGKVIAERRFVGLFTGRVYNDSPSTMPLLRQKIEHVVSHAGLAPNSHDGKALLQILETYPRDELFQIDPQELFETAMAVLQLQDRRRIALFTRRDPFARYVSCLVYIPRDRYDNALRERFHAILAEDIGGRISASYIQLSESPLARLHIIVKTSREDGREFDNAEIERRLVEAGRGWVDQIQSALGRITPPVGTTRGGLLRRFLNAFPVAYREKFSGEDAVADIPRVLHSGDGETVFWLYRRPDAADTDLSFKIFRTGQPIALSDVLPMLENRGLRVLSETPFKLRPLHADGQPAPRVWLHDFDVQVQDKRPVSLDDSRERFHAAFAATWSGRAEDDGFNRLVLAARLDWREVVILRAYAKYLKQAGLTYSQSYLEQALANQSVLASLLVALFHARFNPATADEVRAAGIVVEIEHAPRATLPPRKCTASTSGE
jgi:glutamate dehydrogenase